MKYILAIIISFPWLYSVIKLKLYKQVHHFYYGLLLVLIFKEWYIWVPGLLIMLDDSVQHTVQAYNPLNLGYQSPLHRLYDWIYTLLPKSARDFLDRL